MFQPDQSFFEFIQSNLSSDPLRLRLSKKGEKVIRNLDLAITQIECRRKNEKKLKHFLSNQKLLFPDSISAEQSTHEAVSRFHASLVTGVTSLLDMTAGLGIDSFSFAKVCGKVTAIEYNNFKAEILKYNSDVLGIRNIEVISGDSISFLKETDKSFDVIYCDPARRGELNQRVYNLHDCQPDIIANINLLLSKGKRILIKASPLLDFKQTCRDFKSLRSFIVVGVKGECKEILIEIDPEEQHSNEKMRNDSNGTNDLKRLNEKNESSVLYQAIDLDADGNVISEFSCRNLNYPLFIAKLPMLVQGVFIYEPSSLIMKLAPWSSLCKVFPGIYKFDLSSNLFLSNEYYPDFPGRITKLSHIIKKQDRKNLKDFPASVVSRNYPESSSEIRARYKLREGDQNFIYASRIEDKPVMLMTNSLEQSKN